jgi:hypothetical protein
MPGVFVPNPVGMAELANSPQIVEAMMAEGKLMEAEIKRLTPGGPDGHAKEEIVTEPAVGIVTLVGGIIVSGARVLSRDPLAHLIEFGTVPRYSYSESNAYRGVMPTYAPFRRVAELTGRWIPDSGRAL